MATTIDEGSGLLSVAVYAVIGAVAAGTVCYVAIGVLGAIVGAILGAIGGGSLGRFKGKLRQCVQLYAFVEGRSCYLVGVVDKGFPARGGAGVRLKKARR